MNVRNLIYNFKCWKQQYGFVNDRYIEFLISVKNHETIEVRLSGWDIVPKELSFKVSKDLIFGTFSYIVGMMSSSIYADMLENELSGELITSVTGYLRAWEQRQ